MEKINLSGQILELKNGKNYYVLHQIEHKGAIYYFSVGITSEEEFTNEYLFFERVERDGKFNVKEVNDEELVKTLASYVKAE